MGDGVEDIVDPRPVLDRQLPQRVGGLALGQMVLGIVEQVLGLRIFNDPPQIHDGNGIGNIFNHAQVVGDEEVGDAEIALQIDYGLGKGYAWSVEYTDDPHPRNTYWEMFGMPMFDLQDAAGVMMELQNCRKTFPNHYVRMMAFDSTRGVESIVMSFIVNRPASEPGFGVVRQEINGRSLRYTVHSYATDKPEGQRY